MAISPQEFSLKENRGKSGSTLTALIALLGIWYLAALALDLRALPLPHAVITVFWSKGLSLIEHSLVSLLRIVFGLGLALAVGIPVGSLLGIQKRVDRVLGPLLYLLYPVPKIAFLPIFLVLFGLGDTSKVLIIFVIAVFQITVTVRDGVRATDPHLIESLRTMGASDWQIYSNGIFPGTLPKIFTALRISLGTALATLFFTETFATFHGLGYFIMDAWSRVSYPEMFSGILALGILGFSLFQLIDRMEHRVCRWR